MLVESKLWHITQHQTLEGGGELKLIKSFNFHGIHFLKFIILVAVRQYIIFFYCNKFAHFLVKSSDIFMKI